MEPFNFGAKFEEPINPLMGYGFDPQKSGKLKSDLKSILPELNRVQSIVLKSGDISFDVRNSDNMSLSASAAVSITTITNGYNGQILTLRFTDSNVTLVHSATGARGTINLGNSNFTGAAYDVIQLLNDGISWYLETGTGSGGAKTATFVIGPSSNSDSSSYDYITDGTNDDVQIQAAIDALPSTGGSICFREGTYTLGSATVNIAKNGVHLFGMGRGTIITCKTNFDSTFFLLGSASIQYSDCLFYNIYFDGNQANQSAWNGRYVIDNLTLSKDIQNLHIVNCEFVNTSEVGIVDGSINLDVITMIVGCSFSAWKAGEHALSPGQGNVINCNFIHTDTGTPYLTGGGTVMGCNFVLPDSYNAICAESMSNFEGNSIFAGNSLGSSSQLVSTCVTCSGNYVNVGTSAAGKIFNNHRKNIGNDINIGASAAATFIGVDASDVVSGNAIIFADTPNASAIGIKNANLLGDNFIEMSAGIPVSPLPTVASQFDKTTNTTLANITGLTKTLLATNTYEFEAVLFVDADATGGSKYAIAGTATATTILFEILLLDNTTNAYTITSRETAMAGEAGQAGTTAGLCIIKGLIKVNAGGTLTVQFAQNASNGTSSVLVGSYFKVKLLT